MKTVFANNIKLVNRLFDVLETKEIVACDIETSGLNFNEDKILCIGFSWDGHLGVTLPFYHNQNKLEINSFRLKKIFETKQWIFHNGQFDIKFLRKLGFKVSLNFDTLLAHYLLDERPGTHGLKQLAWNYLNIPNWEEEIKGFLPNKTTSFETIPLSTLSKYCATDAVITFKLYRLFKEKLNREGLEKLFNKLILPASRVLLEMEEQGCALDRPYLEALDNYLLHKQFELRKKLIEMSFGKINNFNSPQQLHNFLYNELELHTKISLPSKILEQIKSKTITTDKQVLNLLAAHHRFPQTLLEYRALGKLQTTYSSGLPKLISKKTGRIHTSYRLHGTVTGRLASRQPNLQNIPRNSMLKNAFIAPSKYRLVELDYCQAELRVLAFIANDEKLKIALDAEIDVHTLVASQITHKPSEEITQEERVWAKTIVFGLLYGRGAVSIANALKISIREAQNFIDEFLKQFPKIKKFIYKTHVTAITDGEIKSLTGRRRRLPELRELRVADLNYFGRINYDSRKLLNKAQNFPIQSLASDITLMALVRINNYLKEKNFQTRPILTVHDSLVFEAPSREIPLVLDEIKDLMETTPREVFRMNLLFPVDIKISKCWGKEELSETNREEIMAFLENQKIEKEGQLLLF